MTKVPFDPQDVRVFEIEYATSQQGKPAAHPIRLKPTHIAQKESSDLS